MCVKGTPVDTTNRPQATASEPYEIVAPNIYFESVSSFVHILVWFDLHTIFPPSLALADMLFTFVFVLVEVHPCWCTQRPGAAAVWVWGWRGATPCDSSQTRRRKCIQPRVCEPFLKCCDGGMVDPHHRPYFIGWSGELPHFDERYRVRCWPILSRPCLPVTCSLWARVSFSALGTYNFCCGHTCLFCVGHKYNFCCGHTYPFCFDQTYHICCGQTYLFCFGCDLI
jgi:hypothetical protein